MKEIFYAEIRPVPKPRLPNTMKFGKLAKRFWDYKKQLQLEAKIQGFIPAHALDMTFYMPLPKKKGLRKPGDPHKQTPDIDNLVKGALDSLFEDDSVVYEVRARKVWNTFGGIEIRNLTGGNG